VLQAHKVGKCEAILRILNWNLSEGLLHPRRGVYCLNYEAGSGDILSQINRKSENPTSNYNQEIFPRYFVSIFSNAVYKYSALCFNNLYHFVLNFDDGLPSLTQNELE
jgi:hypothetical protein